MRGTGGSMGVMRAGIVGLACTFSACGMGGSAGPGGPGGQEAIAAHGAGPGEGAAFSADIYQGRRGDPPGQMPELPPQASGRPVFARDL